MVTQKRGKNIRNKYDSFRFELKRQEREKTLNGKRDISELCILFN